MITVKTAQQKILRQHRPLGAEQVRLQNALGRTIFESVAAKTDLPVWDNSAMDGFTFSADDTKNATAQKPVRLLIKGLARAGDSLQNLKKKTAFKIMTGAMIPRGADTVLPIEEACIEGQFLVVSEPIKKGKHLRRQGEEIVRGQKLLRRGEVVTPGTVALLATAGIDVLRVFRSPRVAVIATGSELISPGKKLRSGEIYESNSIMLAAALRASGFETVMISVISDHRALLRQKVKKAFRKADVLLLSGGVSVGEYDFSKSELKKMGVRTVFWKVAQKPGKPIYFGKKGARQSVFGLPGNPASAFVCFYQYVYPALRILAGKRNLFLPSVPARLEMPVRCDRSKTLFLKAFFRGGQVRILPCQGSHMVSSLHEANALAVVPSSLKKELPAGQTVEVYLLEERRWE